MSIVLTFSPFKDLYLVNKAILVPCQFIVAFSEKNSRCLSLKRWDSDMCDTVPFFFFFFSVSKVSARRRHLQGTDMVLPSGLRFLLCHPEQ